MILEFFKREGNTYDLVSQINFSEENGKLWKHCTETCRFCDKSYKKDEWIAEQVLRVTEEVLK